MIEIKEYKSKYAEAMSKIIINNLLEVNSKDYGIEYVQKSAKEFTVPEIQNNFPIRTKVFVALENNTVVGTASLLIQEIEKYAQKINAKKLVIPASIAGCEFYHKLGYEYKDGKKELNNDQMYIMEKYL